MSRRKSTTHHRANSIVEVALGKITVNPEAQRELKQHRVDYLCSAFDLDDFGLPTLSYRDGKYFVVDGQHRLEALKKWLGTGWELQKIECRVYKGLTAAEEADLFDRLNDTLSVSAFDKFRVRVNAKRDIETAIAAVVHEQGLVISREKVGGAISAVGTLVRVFNRSDAATLGKALRIIRDAFGDAGLESQVIDGFGHLCQRYNGSLEESEAVSRLADTRGGVHGLLGKAEVLHKQTGNGKALCVAAAAVEIINSGRGRSANRLPSWWKAEGDRPTV